MQCAWDALRRSRRIGPRVGIESTALRRHDSRIVRTSKKVSIWDIYRAKGHDEVMMLCRISFEGLSCSGFWKDGMCCSCSFRVSTNNEKVRRNTMCQCAGLQRWISFWWICQQAHRDNMVITIVMPTAWVAIAARSSISMMLGHTKTDLHTYYIYIYIIYTIPIIVSYPEHHAPSSCLYWGCFLSSTVDRWRIMTVQCMIVWCTFFLWDVSAQDPWGTYKTLIFEDILRHSVELLAASFCVGYSPGKNRIFCRLESMKAGRNPLVTL